LTDEEFIQSFETCKISKEGWKHKDHLRMAWFYLKQGRTYESALQKIRSGIQKLNLSHGNPTGYHETVTPIFAIYIYRKLCAAPVDQTFEEFYAANPWLYDGANPFRKRHYSDGLWRSPEARAQFVEPDLEPLPKIEV
jgi:hypothetical protein